MKAKNSTALRGIALRSAANAVASRIRIGYKSAFYAEGEQVTAVSAKTLTWRRGKLGEYGFCNAAARSAVKNPGFIFVG